MPDLHAFSLTDPKVATDYLAAQERYVAAGRRAYADALTLGATGVFAAAGIFAPRRVLGLATDTPDSPPAGWVYVKRRGMLVPDRGQAGESAKQWLADHALPLWDARTLLAEHGLPRNSQSAKDVASFHMMVPQIVELDGTLWALYTGHVDGECTWEPRKVSEFYAALEQRDARKAAVEVGHG